MVRFLRITKIKWVYLIGAPAFYLQIFRYHCTFSCCLIIYSVFILILALRRKKKRKINHHKQQPTHTLQFRITILFKFQWNDVDTFGTFSFIQFLGVVQQFIHFIPHITYAFSFILWMYFVSQLAYAWKQPFK